ALAQVAAHVEAAAPGQHHVEDHEVEAFGRGHVEAEVAVGGAGDVVALGGQAVGEGEAQAGLDLHEEVALLHDVAALDTAAGRRSVNTLPRSAPVSTLTPPPWISAMRRTRLRPRPLP